MEQRYRKMGAQLGKQIPDPGAHIPHVVAGLVRKRRSKNQGLKEILKGGSKVDPRKEYDPHPMEFLPGSM